MDFTTSLGSGPVPGSLPPTVFHLNLLASLKLSGAWLLELFPWPWGDFSFLLQELRERVLRGKYRIPFYMSTDCENLLKKFLILNPSKRGTLEVSS